MPLIAQFVTDITVLLQQSPVLSYVVVAVLGLCVGSFLNVVIHRLPTIMQQEWHYHCQCLLEPDKANSLTPPNMTLSQPASHCPTCQHRIRWYENIPLLSWLFLKGQCSGCKTPISIRYPLIELLTALLSVLVLWRFGISLTMVAALSLTWCLVALTAIDFDTQLLPDSITLPLAGLGLLVNTQQLFVSPSQAIVGYVVGFLCLWVVFKVYLFFTGKEGMGYGDFKLLAALGAWFGVAMLPLIVLLSSLMGSVIGVVLMRLHGESKPFAFGPYIAMAGFVALLFGKDIMVWYLGTPLQ